MAITFSDLKFFQSERMADTADGGGQMSGTEILPGGKNQIFDDVSDVDRAAGDVSIRKCYADVASTNSDKYLDAGIALIRAPSDPATNVLLFSTGDFYDTRADMKSRIEQTISRGGRWNGWLWGQHLAGARAVVLWQRPENELPPVGARLELVARASSVEQYSQFVWITRTTTALRTRTDSNGNYTVREIVCEISEPLERAFGGSEPGRVEPSGADVTMIYGTRYNAEAVALHGTRPTVADAGVGDYSIRVDSLYAPLIPTALQEVALANINPGGDSPALIGGNPDAINWNTTAVCMGPNLSLFLGTGCYPGSLSIAVAGATLTDANGVVRLAGTDVGHIDYSAGVVTWNASCPSYGSAFKVITMKPACAPLRVADTAALRVTTGNRGYVWTITLDPIPAPKTLRVSYRVNNQWYVLEDQGGGILAGIDSSYGSGALNFGNGSITVTTGALPDVDSEILFAWGTAANYTWRGGDPVDAPVMRFQVAHSGVAPGTVSAAWTVGGITRTLTDAANNGVLSGTGGVGFIRYATGEGWVRPDNLPPVGTALTLSYDYGAPIVENFAHPARDGNSHLALTLAHPNVRPHSVEVEWNPSVVNFAPDSTTPANMQVPPSYASTQTIRDNGSGALLIPTGTNGTINYAAGTLDFLPDLTISLPFPRYRVVATGATWQNNQEVVVYRSTFAFFEYFNAPAQYPNDSSGAVTVRYRVTGGDTSASETFTLDQLQLDLTKGYSETIAAGSVRFLLGGSAYVSSSGQIYRDPSPITGAGTLAGSWDRSTGRVWLSSWTSGGANAVTLESLVTELAGQPVEEVVFRTPVAPIRPGSLQMTWRLLTGATKTKTIDDTGILEDTDATISVNAALGVIRARFGHWKADADVTPGEKLEVWYDADARVTIGGILKIWKPALVLADSIRYNAVAQSVLPPDSALLGLNAARLPVDGKALIFNTGRLALVHHTDSVAASSLSPTQVIDCGRERLWRAVISDSTGKRLGFDQFTLNHAAGTVTMSPTLDLTGFSGPFAVAHTVADLARLTRVDINGTLQLNKPLSHVYPQDDTRVSSVLYVGTLQARITNVFMQTAWTGVWSDSRLGDEPLAQYNNVQWPILTTNAGAYPDRFLIKFTSSSAFQVIGEQMGIIATGTTTDDCAPVNPLTGAALFTLRHQGWGAGLSVGNCLRFNLIGACYPVGLIRPVQPSQPTELAMDDFEIVILGNINE